jgi:hypothetical protein
MVHDQVEQDYWILHKLLTGRLLQIHLRTQTSGLAKLVARVDSEREAQVWPSRKQVLLAVPTRYI